MNKENITYRFTPVFVYYAIIPIVFLVIFSILSKIKLPIFLPLEILAVFFFCFFMLVLVVGSLFGMGWVSQWTDIRGATDLPVFFRVSKGKIKFFGTRKGKIAEEEIKLIIKTGTLIFRTYRIFYTQNGVLSSVLLRIAGRDIEGKLEQAVIKKLPGKNSSWKKSFMKKAMHYADTKGRRTKTIKETIGHYFRSDCRKDNKDYILQGGGAIADCRYVDEALGEIERKGYMKTGPTSFVRLDFAFSLPNPLVRLGIERNEEEEVIKFNFSGYVFKFPESQVEKIVIFKDKNLGIVHSSDEVPEGMIFYSSTDPKTFLDHFPTEKIVRI